MTSKKNSTYIVRETNGSGSQYLVRRTTPTAVGRYRWSRSARTEAAVLSYDAARKVVLTYGGEMVKA